MQSKFVKPFVMAVTIIFLFLLFTIWSLMQIGIEAYRILSGSMEPVLRFGDIVLVNTNNQEAVRGDIIAFRIGGNVVVHRVVEREENGTYITKGDANENNDFQPVESERVIGIVCGKLRYSTWLWMIVTTKLRYAVLVGIVVLNLITDRISEGNGGILVGDG